MITENAFKLAENQALTVTAVGNNVADLDVAAPYAAGFTDEELYLVCGVDVAVVAGSNTGIVVTLESDDNESFTTATTRWTAPSMDPATLTPAGTQIILGKVPIGAFAERYVRAKFTMTTAQITSGTLSLRLVKDPFYNTKDPSNVINLG